MEINGLNSCQYLIILQTQEMEHFKEIIQPLSKNVVINIPDSIRFTNSLTNLKY